LGLGYCSARPAPKSSKKSITMRLKLTRFSAARFFAGTRTFCGIRIVNAGARSESVLVFISMEEL